MNVVKIIFEKSKKMQKSPKRCRKVQKDAENRQRQATVIKTHAANAYTRGEIAKEEMDKKYAESDRLQKPIKELKEKVRQKLKPKIKPKKLKAITAKGQRGRGVVFFL